MSPTSIAMILIIGGIVRLWIIPAIIIPAITHINKYEIFVFIKTLDDMIRNTAIMRVCIPKTRVRPLK